MKIPWRIYGPEHVSISPGDGWLDLIADIETSSVCDSIRNLPMWSQVAVQHLRENAQREGLTPERINQIRCSNLQRLRKALEETLQAIEQELAAPQE